MQMDSIAFFTIETGGQKGHVIWILTNQQAACGDVMPSSSMVKGAMKVHEHAHTCTQLVHAAVHSVERCCTVPQCSCAFHVMWHIKNPFMRYNLSVCSLC